MKLYADTLKVIEKGVGYEEESIKTEAELRSWGIKLIDAFLEDDDIQEIIVASSNLGFIKTFRKQSLKKSS